jgi:AcrR family transcriptional regulator
MPARLLSRTEVVERLAAVFRRHGYDGATLSLLSQATGLGKASLYHHFPGGKEEMAGAVLEQAEASLRAQVLAPLRAQGAARDRLEAMARAVERRYAGGREPCLLASLSLGERAPYQERLRRTFRAWMGAIADTLVAAGLGRAEAAARAEEAVLRVEGALVLAAGLGSPAPFRTVVKHLPATLLAGVPAQARPGRARRG